MLLPPITWKGTPNFTPGRPLHPDNVGGPQARVDKFVLHWMDGTLADADAAFASDYGGNLALRRSAHFGVGADGTVHQYVRVADTSWNAGNWQANCSGIGIEHEGAPGVAITDACYAASAALQAYLAAQLGIELSLATVFPHSRFRATACPGTLDIPRLIADSRKLVGNVTTVEIVPAVAKVPVQSVPGFASNDFTVVFDAALHVRTHPSVNAPIAATYPAGSVVECKGVAAGDPVVDAHGAVNHQWYVSKLHGWYFTAAYSHPQTNVTPQTI